MPRPRLPENEGLPTRWVVSHGAYFYQVPPGLECFWDHKRKYRLGATLEEAMTEFLRRVGNPVVATGLESSSLLTREEILGMASRLPKSGVYFLISQSEVIYVGRSDSVAERIATHVRTGAMPFDSTHVIPANGVEMARLEQLYIGMLKPRFNVCFTTVGRV